MRILLLVATLVSMSSSVHAATAASCISKVAESCRVNTGLWLTMTFSDSCKIVDYKPTSTHTVALVASDKRTLVAVDTDTCRLASYTLQSGEVNDLGVLEGRVFLTLSSNRVVMIGRDASINELNNSKGESYSDVVGVKIDQENGGIVLERERNQKTPLSREQIQNRVDQRKLNLLASPY